jgi:hypothetical protein
MHFIKENTPELVHFLRQARADSCYPSDGREVIVFEKLNHNRLISRLFLDADRHDFLHNLHISSRPFLLSLSLLTPRSPQRGRTTIAGRSLHCMAQI